MEGAQPADIPAEHLTPGESIERHLSNGETHLFTISLEAGSALEIDVEQRGVDVVVGLTNPDGDSLEVDAPLGARDREHLCWVARSSGQHQLRLRPFAGSAGGSYSLRSRLWRSASERESACRAASELFSGATSRPLDSDGDLQEPCRRYRRASDLWAKAPGHRFQRALALREEAGCLERLGDLKGEGRALQRASELMEAEGETAQRAILLNLLGLNHFYRAETAAAHSFFARALDLARESQRPDVEAAAWNNQALLADSTGDTLAAVELYNRALGIWRSLGERRLTALALYNLGVAQTNLGHFEVATDLLHQALEIYRAVGDLEDRAAVLSALGWIHHLEGEAAAAVETFTRSLDFARRSGSYRREAEALDRLGSAYLAQEEFSQARSAYETARDIAQDSGNDRDLAHSLANLGWLLLEEGRVRQGRIELENARELFSRLGDRNGLAHATVGLATADRALGDLLGARDRLEKALGIVRSLRSSARRRGVLEGPHGVWQDYYERYVDLLVELDALGTGDGLLVRAFEVSDLARAKNFYELLLESEIDLRTEIDPGLLAREREIQERINAESRISERRGRARSATPGESSRQLPRLLLELEEIQAAIRSTNPRFAEIADPEIIAASEIQRRLSPNTLLLSYVLGDRRSFLFSVTRHSLKVDNLPPRSEIEDLARIVYEGLRSRRRGSRGRQLDLTAAALSQDLLGPVAAELRKATRILIVTEGGLLYIPFSSLPFPGMDGSLLVDELEIVHLPLAAARVALARREANRSPAPKLLALFADPVFSADDPRVARRGTPKSTPPPKPSDGLDLPRLPESRREARGILALVGSHPHLSALDFEANRELALSGALAEYRLIHFATHAIVDDRHPELSGLVVSRVDREGRPRDGFLRLHEIFTLELPADLVVLSACRTALGERRRGDGMVGLTRGFFYAGASRLLVSLWDVADGSTAELMIEFYRGLLIEELPPASALRRSQLLFRQRHPDLPPYHWAGFVLQGLG